MFTIHLNMIVVAVPGVFCQTWLIIVVPGDLIVIVLKNANFNQIISFHFLWSVDEMLRMKAA
jgi:hypothetical protein